MDGVAAVGEGERFADAAYDAQPLGQCWRPREIAIETRTGDQLHGVERAAVGECSAFVHGDDGGMFELRDDARLALDCAVEHLDGDAPIEVAIVRGINDAQATAPDFALQFIAGAGKIGQRADAAEMVEHAIAQVHTFRSSVRSSRGPETVPLRRSCTSARSVRRAHAR